MIFRAFLPALISFAAIAGAAPQAAAQVQKVIAQDGRTPDPIVTSGLDPKTIANPPADSWPSYSGDYSGQRFSALKGINAGNVKNLSLAWSYRGNTRAGGAIVGGEGPDNPGGETVAIKSSPILHDGVLYMTSPDHVWAVDARTGREIWHYFWKTRGGLHIGNRGVAMYGNYLFFLTPDNYFVSLDARTGKERWHIEVANVKREYFDGNAPIIVRNHVIIGMSGDSLDVPGYIESRDPETGALQWRWLTTPRAGEPGIETWPNEEAAAHGAGQPWVPGVYDPQSNLYYFGTGNPNPVHASQGRAGDNLWTCSIIALNPDTGKMVWYYQVSPHDTHDWDGAITPILINDKVGGEERKLIAFPARHGIYFLLDRMTGKVIASAPMVKSLNWMIGQKPDHQPIPDPSKNPSLGGALVSPSNPGVTNWPAMSFNPQTGLLYTGTSQSYSLYYLSDLSERPQGYGGIERGVGNDGTALKAFDYKTGKEVWSRELARTPDYGLTGAMGLLSTAGGLLFGNDGGGNFVAYNAKTGKPLWHANLAVNTSNAPSTYELDGRQYVIVGAGDTLYSFYLQ